jgi:hypothetical protein
VERNLDSHLNHDGKDLALTCLKIDATSLVFQLVAF